MHLLPMLTSTFACGCVCGAQVESKILVGIFLCVFVKKKLANAIHELQGTTAGVGMLGVMVRRELMSALDSAGAAFPRRQSHTSLRLPHRLFSSLSCARASGQGNKGAAAIRFRFYDSTLCFVCSHLAAHQNNVAGRNADFANIVSKIEFRNAGVADRCALPTTIRSRSSVLPVSALRRGMN